MVREGWVYTNIPIEMALALDDIIIQKGKKYGITDRNQFIRLIIAGFLQRYEGNNGDQQKQITSLTSDVVDKLFSEYDKDHHHQNHQNEEGEEESVTKKKERKTTIII